MSGLLWRQLLERTDSVMEPEVLEALKYATKEETPAVPLSPISFVDTFSQNVIKMVTDNYQGFGFSS